MIRSGHIFSLFIFLAGFFPPCVSYANKDDVVDNFFPSNVELGISAEELLIKRPNVFEDKSFYNQDDPSGVKPKIKYLEIYNDNGVVVYSYLFESSKLRAIAVAIPILDSFDTVWVSNLEKDLSLNYLKTTEEDIVRLSKSLDFEKYKLQLWRDEKVGLDLYYLATTDEVNLIVYDSSYVGKDDFFVDPNKIPDLNEKIQPIKKMLGLDQEGKLRVDASMPIGVGDQMPEVINSSNSVNLDQANNIASDLNKDGASSDSVLTVVEDINQKDISSEPKNKVEFWYIGLVIVMLIILVVYRSKKKKL